MGQKFDKNSNFFTISSLYVPYSTVTAKNRGLQAAYVAFWQGPAKLPDSIRIRIGRPASIRFESDGQTQNFRIAAPATFAIVQTTLTVQRQISIVSALLLGFILSLIN